MDGDGVAALLSVASVMLAAFGFFYTQVADDIARAIRDTETLREKSRRSERADVSRRVLVGKAVPLALGAMAVAALLLPDALSILTAIDPAAPWDATRAALVVLVLFWAALAVAMSRQVLQLRRRWRADLSRR